jgi:hypothetical protein
MDERYAVVSCHVERPLDNRAWERFARLQARFPIAALIRPPDEAAGEDPKLWLERARLAAARGSLGHHTHWGGPSQARPTGGEPAERVRREGEWLREQGLTPTLFCGGGWYLDAEVASATAELGYADCTATAFRPGYLERGAPRLAAQAPCRLALPGGGELLELPTTHSLGMLARSICGRLPAYVHVYFHDTDLLDGMRAAALGTCLRALALRYGRRDLEELARQMRALELPVNRAFVH